MENKLPEDDLKESLCDFHIGSFGFLWLKPKDGISNVTFHQYIDVLFSSLERNLNFIEISPSSALLKKWYSEGEIYFYQASTEKSLFLSRFVKIKVVIPKRKVAEIIRYANFWNPEEFTIYFNGQVFAILAKTTEYPVRTEVIKIAHRLLLDVVSNSEIWDVVDNVDPKFIHTDIYLKPQGETNFRGLGYKVEISDGNVCVNYNKKSSPHLIFEKLLVDSVYSLSGFFDQRMAAASYSIKVQGINKLNQELASLVTNYFSIPKHKLIFSEKSREIRKLIAEMHKIMQEISNHEEILRKTKKDAVEKFDGSIVFGGFKEYFENQMDSDIVFNREAQLNMMNFAVSEGNTFSTTQATIIAALIGAFLASLLTIIFSK